MEVDEWLSDRARLTQKSLLEILSSDLPGIAEYSVIQLRSIFVLSAVVVGRDSNGSALWTLPCTFLPENGTAADRGPHFSAAELNRGTGRILLRNLVEAAGAFGINVIEAYPMGGRSPSYLEAGFLPRSGQTWSNLCKQMNQAFEPNFKDRHLLLRMALDGITASNNPATIRALVRDPESGLLAAPWSTMPLETRQLLSALDWSGGLDLGDPESARRFRCFTASKT
jgi:hypothetical protein